MESSSQNVRKPPIFLMVIVTVLIALSVVTLFQILKMYHETGYLDFLALTLSASAIAFSIYMTLQLRREPFKLGFEPQKVSTVIRCSKCDYEATRQFKEGDYVLKEEEEACPKCGGSTFIYMIFREVEEKKKK